jgi:hypothetical protein
MKASWINLNLPLKLILFWAGRMGARSVPKVPKVEIVRARVDSAPFKIKLVSTNRL